jgi:CRP-like cAMP-binding protein
MKQSMDRGIRILGGFILVFLYFFEGNIDSNSKLIAIAVGLYGFVTGVVNFCPLSYLILKERMGKRKKTSIDEEIGINDVKSLYFFEGLNDDEISRVLSICQIKQYPKHFQVIVEGSHNKTLYIIYSGQFKIVKSIAESESKIIGTISDGETFGELSFFGDSQPGVSVVSMEDSILLEIDETEFFELTEKDPQIGIKILRCLLKITSARMRAMNDQITSLGNWVVQRRTKVKQA